jgi:hypothetical protein
MGREVFSGGRIALGTATGASGTYVELGVITLGAATDGHGNVCIAGYNDGSLGRSLQGNGDTWVAEYSAAGTLRWKRQLGMASDDSASGVATDGDGNVYALDGRVARPGDPIKANRLFPYLEVDLCQRNDDRVPRCSW